MIKFFGFAFFVTFSTVVFGQSLVEFRGIGRSGQYSESGLLKKWPETGPALLLKIEGVGKGFSQPIVANGKIYISGIKKDTTDILSSYNLKGELLWETPYGRSWTASYIDSRSTPTFENDKLYIASGTGQMNCVDAETGKIIWQVNTIEKYGGEIYKHGDAESPLVIAEAVLFTTGGEQNTLVALNKNTGDLLWKTKSLGGAKSYASPTLIKHNGREMILAQTSRNLIAIEPKNGEVIWSYDLIQYHTLDQGEGANTNPPIYFNGELFVTSGYNHPGILFTLSENGDSVQEKWKNETIDTHHGGVVLVNGNLFGSNWENNSNGNWTSVNWSTGKTNWEQKWENKGSVITADGMLYMYEEKRGNVALAKPSAEKLDIVSTFKIDAGAGPHWAHPAIFDGRLFIRHGDVLLVYDIKDK